MSELFTSREFVYRGGTWRGISVGSARPGEAMIAVGIKDGVLLRCERVIVGEKLEVMPDGAIFQEIVPYSNVNLLSQGK